MIGITNGKLVSAKAAPAVFVGYDEQREAYLVLTEQQGRFSNQPVSQRDVLFDENCFPFKQTQKKTQSTLKPGVQKQYGNTRDSDSDETEVEIKGESLNLNPSKRMDFRAVTPPHSPERILEASPASNRLSVPDVSTPQTDASTPPTSSLGSLRYHGERVSRRSHEVEDVSITK